MGFPSIKVQYQNGLLGTVADSQDGLVLLCAKGAGTEMCPVGKPQKIYRLTGLEDLGITGASYPALHSAVKQFYTEASEGTGLYVVLFSDASMSAALDKDSGSLRGILQALRGEVRVIAMIHPDDEDATVEGGLSKDVYDAIKKAQTLGDWTATEMYAPIAVILDGYAYNGSAADLTSVAEKESNRVMVLLGSDTASGKHSAIGYLAGRIAESPVQRNIGRVKDGGIAAERLYLGAKPVEEAMDDVKTIYEKGFVTPRIHVGRSGYYFTDDRLAVKETDDYAHLTARRTIDKVLRIAYDTLLNTLLDEVELNDDGTMQEGVIRSIESDVETAVNQAMTASGELSSVDGSGVECSIDGSQNVRATSTIEVVVAARPFGYPRTIIAKLGFKVE